ncbi:MAG: hypothetical protein QM622_11305 [Microbacterium sp.]
MTDARRLFALRQLVVEPLTRDEILSMRASSFELTNDEVEEQWVAEG